MQRLPQMVISLSYDTDDALAFVMGKVTPEVTGRALDIIAKVSTT